MAIGPRIIPNGTASLNRVFLKKSSNMIARQALDEDQTNSNHHIGHMKNLFDEIESIKPDHEHRRLAIEVDKIFFFLLLFSN